MSRIEQLGDSVACGVFHQDGRLTVVASSVIGQLTWDGVHISGQVSEADRCLGRSARPHMEQGIVGDLLSKIKMLRVSRGEAERVGDVLAV